ncbi:MAG: hypothetical protein JWM99_3779 [Verrucomicrobiales bacterium]|nr:hypothetical protein [Verrucomicrobiales bacterium]
MRYMHGAYQIYLQNAGPICWCKIPKGKTKPTRSSAHGKHQMIEFTDALSEGLHLFIDGDIADGQCRAGRLGRRGIITVEAMHLAALRAEACRDSLTDPADGAKNCYALVL